MKRMIVSALVACCWLGIYGQNVEDTLESIDTIQSSTTDELDAAKSIISPQGLQVELENPHSRALGQRIAGYVVGGTGILDVVLGIVFDVNDVFADMYDDLGQRETGEMFEKLMYVEGGIRLLIGVALVSHGYSKYSQWKKWETEHGRVSVRFDGTRVVVMF